MFLRRHCKHSGGETCEYGSRVKTVRTARGSRHQVVARRGKLDGVEASGARAWRDVDALLEGRPSATPLEPSPPPIGRPARSGAGATAGAAGVELPGAPRVVDNVVPENALSKTQLPANQAKPCLD